MSFPTHRRLAILTAQLEQEKKLLQEQLEEKTFLILEFEKNIWDDESTLTANTKPSPEATETQEKNKKVKLIHPGSIITTEDVHNAFIVLFNAAPFSLDQTEAEREKYRIFWKTYRKLLEEFCTLFQIKIPAVYSYIDIPDCHQSRFYKFCYVRRHELLPDLI